MSARPSPWKGVTLLTSMAAYCLGGPITSVALGSWWPMAIGFGWLLAVVFILVAVQVVQDARKPKTPTLAEAIDEAIVEIAVNAATERRQKGAQS